MTIVPWEVAPTALRVTNRLAVEHDVSIATARAFVFLAALRPVMRETAVPDPSLALSLACAAVGEALGVDDAKIARLIIAAGEAFREEAATR